MDITIEERLRLLQKMREDAGSNENALQVRRQILGNPEYSVADSGEYLGTGGYSSFKIRMFFSVLLFFGYVILQYSSLSIGAFSAPDIVNIISESSDTNLFDFSAQLPYTLEE